MIKVITYGTYDRLHRGHIRLLERAKALGDYLIVGVTSDDYDRTRGKINAAQSLMERIESVRATGLADEIVIEEYEGQKIDDIRRFDIDIFTVGSDWEGQFDYLNEYCKVVYLPRTEGVSSSEIRSRERSVRLGIFGPAGRVVDKYVTESGFVNGLQLAWVCGDEVDFVSHLADCDAVYIQSHPKDHVRHVKMAMEAGKHVICESPIALSGTDCKSLFDLASSKRLVLMDAIKTAYSTAYNRMLLLIKSGKIGKVMSVDATCTSLMDSFLNIEELSGRWNSRCAWGPAALLAVLQILGVDYESCTRTSFYADGSSSVSNCQSHFSVKSTQSMGECSGFDIFTKYDFKYKDAVASVKVGKGVKSEGELVVSGTKGYIYVPAPWWKTDYFEVRYENPADNRRYFYQLDGEGIRNELVQFSRMIVGGVSGLQITREKSVAICGMMSSAS